MSLPPRPQIGSSWFDWGASLHDLVNQLLNRLPSKGNMVAIYPNAQGTGWDVPAVRPPGATYLWARRVSNSVLAPVPTYEIGYQDRDFVFPLAEGEALPVKGIIWSDSLLDATYIDNLEGRFTNSYAGGQQFPWITEGDIVESRVRIEPTYGFESYSAGYGRVDCPDSQDYRISFNISRNSASYQGGAVFRGTPGHIGKHDIANKQYWAVWFAGNNSGTLKVSAYMVNGLGGGGETTYLFGEVPFTTNMRVVLTLSGSTVTIEIAGKKYNATIPAEAMAWQRLNGFTTVRWTSFECTNVVYEVL